MTKPTPDDMLRSLKDIVRICEAIRYTVGLGKGQLDRIDRAKAIIKRAEEAGK